MSREDVTQVTQSERPTLFPDLLTCESNFTEVTVKPKSKFFKPLVEYEEVCTMNNLDSQESCSRPRDKAYVTKQKEKALERLKLKRKKKEKKKLVSSFSDSGEEFEENCASTKTLVQSKTNRNKNSGFLAQKFLVMSGSDDLFSSESDLEVADLVVKQQPATKKFTDSQLRLTDLVVEQEPARIEKNSELKMSDLVAVKSPKNKDASHEYTQKASRRPLCSKNQNRARETDSRPVFKPTRKLEVKDLTSTRSHDPSSSDLDEEEWEETVRHQVKAQENTTDNERNPLIGESSDHASSKRSSSEMVCGKARTVGLPMLKKPKVNTNTSEASRYIRSRLSVKKGAGVTSAEEVEPESSGIMRSGFRSAFSVWNNMEEETGDGRNVSKGTFGGLQNSSRLTRGQLAKNKKKASATVTLNESDLQTSNLSSLPNTCGEDIGHGVIDSTQGRSLGGEQFEEPLVIPGRGGNSSTQLQGTDNQASSYNWTGNQSTFSIGDNTAVDESNRDDHSVPAASWLGPQPTLPVGSGGRPTRGRRSRSSNNKSTQNPRNEQDVICLDDSIQISGESAGALLGSEQLESDEAMARRLQEEMDLEYARHMAQKPATPQANPAPPVTQPLSYSAGNNVITRIGEMSPYVWNVHKNIFLGQDIPDRPSNEPERELDEILDNEVFTFLETSSPGTLQSVLNVGQPRHPQAMTPGDVDSLLERRLEQRVEAFEARRNQNRRLPDFLTQTPDRSMERRLEETIEAFEARRNRNRRLPGYNNQDRYTELLTQTPDRSMDEALLLPELVDRVNRRQPNDEPPVVLPTRHRGRRGEAGHRRRNRAGHNPGANLFEDVVGPAHNPRGHRRNRGDDFYFQPLPPAVDMDDYEGLLQLGEALGDVRKKGLNQHEIRRLPTTIYKHSNNSAAATTPAECNICCCEFEEGDELRILPCFHNFHSPCIDKWIVANATCPVCRAAVKLT